MLTIDIDIVIKCKCGNLLTEISRETEPIYGDRLVVDAEQHKIERAKRVEAGEEIWCEGDRRG